MKTKSKSKYTNYIYYTLISVLLGLCALLSSNNWIVCVLVMVIFLVYFFFRTQKAYVALTKRGSKTRLVYTLINNVITSISVYKNVDAAVDKCLENIDFSNYKEIGDMSNMSGSEKLTYLASYFSLPIYDAFMNIISLYTENGGDILAMSEYLLSELKQIESQSITLNSFNKSRSMSIGILWVIALVIPIFIRFALSDFYTSLCNSAFYVIGIALVYLCVLVTVELMTGKMLHQRIKGVDL